ncbi:hypothetical protein GGI11_006293, partial [Coemansia sp. RSA 2049]
MPAEVNVTSALGNAPSDIPEDSSFYLPSDPLEMSQQRAAMPPIQISSSECASSYGIMRTPEHAPLLSSSFHGSPRTKILGRRIRLGISGWAGFIEKQATLVDKSTAIVDVMDSDSSDVVAGIYPRRMGKTTFLQTLADFLGIIRPMPRADREDQFKRCALYDLHRDFFEENFAKYPVITMDFK